MGMRVRRTQEARIAALFARPRTYYRAAECVPAAGVSLFSGLLAGVVAHPEGAASILPGAVLG